MSWIGHTLGTDGGAFYNFYSGFGSAVGSITLLGGLFGFFTHRRCHVEGCRHLGKVKVPGTDWTVCPAHHPDGPLTPERLKKHVEAQRAKNAEG